ncbi:MAG TPA: lytic transglycosylase domain-containing protein, partial [Candidatus Scatomorpha intestinipullorum]|nr:lytic transglycosylase domain-containing protein [Candidatus Scatomorpha intestinipullorum]
MKLVIALLTLLFCLVANAKDITLEYLKNQPKGISRDFYIWLFLQQNITPKEATQAYKLSSRENAKIFSLYYKKGDNKTLSRKTICQQMPLPKLLKQDTQCIAFGLTLKESQTLDKKTLLNLSKKLEKQDKMLSTHLRILASKDPFLNLIKTDSKTFASFYFNVSQELKQKLNAPIPKATLIQYISQNNIAFMRFLRQVIINPNMQHLNYSLTQISPKE